MEDFRSGLCAVLHDLGVVHGDILYVSSDIKVLLYKLVSKYGVKGKEQINTALHAFIDCFQEAVGSEGTLLFPVFTWSFCKGCGFDIRSTKGEVGTLGNWVMEHRKEFRRTQHPMYSFMVNGADAEYLSGLSNQDAWGECSPFAYFRDENAKQMLFNIQPHQGMTFVHAVEQEVNIPYRYPKYFFGEYTTQDGKKEMRTYSMFVRDLRVHSTVALKNEFLIRHGAAKQAVWDENVLTIAELGKAHPILKEDMLLHNGENTLCLPNYTLNWSEKRETAYEISGLPHTVEHC